jgi:hypothetical protein
VIKVSKRTILAVGLSTATVLLPLRSVLSIDNETAPSQLRTGDRKKLDGFITPMVEIAVSPPSVAQPGNDRSMGNTRSDRRNSGSISSSDAFLKKAKNVSIVNLNSFALDAVNTDRNNKSVFVDTLLYQSPNNKEAFDSDRNRFYESLRKQQELNDGMQKQLEAFNRAKPYAEKIAAMGGPLVVFSYKAAETYLERFTKTLRDEQENTFKQMTSQYFAGRQLNLDKLRRAKDRGDDAFLAEFKAQANLPPEQDFPNVNPLVRDHALLKLGEFTLEYTYLTGKQIEIEQRRNNEKLNQLMQRSLHIEACQKDMAAKIDKLIENTDKNAAEMERISRQVKDLGLIEKVVMGHLSPEEQIYLVEHSQTLQISDQEKKDLISNLKDRQRIIDDARKWNDFGNHGQDFIGIVDKLGADKNIVDGVQKTFTAGNAAYNAVLAAMTGNYLGAANAVLGMFSGGGADAETAHYNAIMGKLDEIIETQKKIIENQARILDKLRNIENLIIQSHMALSSDLKNVFALQQKILDATVQYAKANMKLCSLFVKAVNSTVGSPSDNAATYSYKQLQETFRVNEVHHNFISCRQFLNKTIGDISADRNPYIGYAALESRKGQENPQITAVRAPFEASVRPIFRFLEYYVPDSDEHQNTVKGSFFFLSTDYGTLKAKSDTALAPENASIPQSSSAKPKVPIKTLSLRTLRPLSSAASKDAKFYYDSLREDNFLSPRDLVEYANWELEINPYRELIAPSGNRLLTSEELYTKKPDHFAEDRLKALFDWLSLAIAQQNLLAGDLLLPFLSSAGFGKINPPQISLDALFLPPAQNDKKEEKEAALAQYVLGRNHLLLQNALRYRIYNLMDEKKISLAGYAFAWHSHNETSMKVLFGDSIKIAWKQQKVDDAADKLSTGWYVPYEFTDYAPDGTPTKTSMFVPLPEPSVVFTREFIPSPELAALVQCRDKVNAQLSQYELSRELNAKNTNPKMLVSLKKLLLMQNYMPREVPASLAATK